MWSAGCGGCAGCAGGVARARGGAGRGVPAVAGVRARTAGVCWPRPAPRCDVPALQ